MRVTCHTSRRFRRCERCSGPIEKGDRYLAMVASPHHDDVGNLGWLRLAECADCARRLNREEFTDA